MFDPACYALARHFLGDLATDRLVDALAQHIQDEVESWLETTKEEIELSLSRRSS